MNNAKPFLCIKLCALRAKTRKVRHQISSDTGEIYPCILDVVLRNRYCYIFILDYGIGACSLVKEHAVIFFSVFIKAVILHAYQYLVFEVKAVKPSVVYRNFRCCTAVKGIQKLRVLKEHHLLIRP